MKFTTIIYAIGSASAFLFNNNSYSNLFGLNQNGEKILRSSSFVPPAAVSPGAAVAANAAAANAAAANTAAANAAAVNPALRYPAALGAAAAAVPGIY